MSNFNGDEFQGKIFQTKQHGEILVLQYNSAKDIEIQFITTGWKTKVAASQIRCGGIKDETVPTVLYGWGLVDVDYPVSRTETLGYVDGKRVQKKVWICPYYKKWSSILCRVFSESQHKHRPNYKDCTICEEWKYLSNFIKWVDSQPNRDWMNCEPDKDILFEGNKHYGPETVVFVDHTTNKFILDSHAKRGDYMLGVDLQRGKFRSRCKDPCKFLSNHIGYYSSELEAHLAWQTRKHEYACKLSDIQSDERVAFVLRNRYAPDKDWTNK